MGFLGKRIGRSQKHGKLCSVRVHKKSRHFADDMCFKMRCCNKKCRGEINAQKLHFYGRCSEAVRTNFVYELNWEFPVAFVNHEKLGFVKYQSPTKMAKKIYAYSVRSTTSVRKDICFVEDENGVYFKEEILNIYAMSEAWKSYKYELLSVHHEKTLDELYETPYAKPDKLFPILNKKMNDIIVVNVRTFMGEQKYVPYEHINKQLQKNKKRRTVCVNENRQIEASKYIISEYINRYKKMDPLQLMHMFADFIEARFPSRTTPIRFPYDCDIFWWPICVWNKDLYYILNGMNGIEEYRNSILKTKTYRGFRFEGVARKLRKLHEIVYEVPKELPSALPPALNYIPIPACLFYDDSDADSHSFIFDDDSLLGRKGAKNGGGA